MSEEGYLIHFNRVVNEGKGAGQQKGLKKDGCSSEMLIKNIFCTINNNT